MNSYIPWFFTVISLTGAFFNSKGKLLTSSIMWLIANLFWLYLDSTRELWAQCGLYLAFIGTNVLGIYTSIKKKG
jgi:hypothetical protein